MKQYIEEYGNDLLYVFNPTQTKNNKELIVVKDGCNKKESTVYCYSDDFEKMLDFCIPTKNRKTKQIISYQESIDLIQRIKYGVLSFSHQGLPYSIGLNHIYKDGKLYFHTGYSGFKLHAINQRVCYLVIEDLGINEAMSTHNHSSTMIQGILRSEEDRDIKKEVLLFLMKELAPTNDKEITKAMIDNTNILSIDIEYIHGKIHVR